MASPNDASSRHDVVVIGAGPAGEAAAELGGSLGYSVALVERDVVGGTVVTSGGAPTKTFREAAVYLSSFEKEKIYGVTLSAPPEVMYPGRPGPGPRGRRAAAAGGAGADPRPRRAPGARRGAAGNRAHRGGPHQKRRSDPAGGRAGHHQIRSSPLRPASVPFDDPGVFDSETVLNIARKPREMLIVGGGAIGVEYATIFSALGVPVTILDHSPPASRDNGAARSPGGSRRCC